MIIKAFRKKNEIAKNFHSDKYIFEKEPKNIYTIFIKPLGITVQILKNPDIVDIDKSGVIDIKESLILGFALSIDALVAGIGSSLLGISSWYLPFVIGLFQLLFLCAGLFFGKYFKNKINIKGQYMSAISGAILIAFSIFKLIWT